ncbi:MULTISPECIES: enoyl-CoA hydratase-related protein [unclassified Kitasatospora]|uniref:enoyl-CoA hydratase-related protein n=1 Tax=unclassified Kitasatospora TaxID=2633591 RepID=UPI000709932B|nr:MULTISPECIES: enoyl-CoA hydratase-related protein [unclassified Kitasatospora]KQV23860.1 enoyl-CoA hydratase [Kitasatospora sp. Root107]KRB67428.1 enoyl-CoA hydratase [Kitasatospora sp. Root187]
MSDSVLFEHDGGLAVITINRPEAMNALDIATKVALRDAVIAAAEDSAVRAVLLTGAGEKAFCVGQDLKEHLGLLGTSDAPLKTVAEHYNPLVRALAGMNKPTVAAVGGVAAGAGASLAFACDFRIVADTAGFNTSFAGVALTADSGASWTLPRLVGHARATELLMFPRTVKAAEAAELGLATKVVPSAELAATAREFAQRLAQGPTVALGAIKTALAYGATHTLSELLDKEDELQTLAGASEDHRIAVNAFVAKQQPVYLGR